MPDLDTRFAAARTEPLSPTPPLATIARRAAARRRHRSVAVGICVAVPIVALLGVAVFAGSAERGTRRPVEPATSSTTVAAPAKHYEATDWGVAVYPDDARPPVMYRGDGKKLGPSPWPDIARTQLPDGTAVDVVTTASQLPETVHRDPSAFACATFAIAGGELGACGSGGGSEIIRDVPDGTDVQVTRFDRAGRVVKILESPDGRWLLIVLDDRDNASVSALVIPNRNNVTSPVANDARSDITRGWVTDVWGDHVRVLGWTPDNRVAATLGFDGDSGPETVATFDPATATGWVTAFELGSGGHATALWTVPSPPPGEAGRGAADPRA